jgi:hypothetical protein
MERPRDNSLSSNSDDPLGIRKMISNPQSVIKKERKKVGKSIEFQAVKYIRKLEINERVQWGAIFRKQDWKRVQPDRRSDQIMIDAFAPNELDFSELEKYSRYPEIFEKICSLLMSEGVILLPRSRVDDTRRRSKLFHRIYIHPNPHSEEIFCKGNQHSLGIREIIEKLSALSPSERQELAWK